MIRLILLLVIAKFLAVACIDDLLRHSHHVLEEGQGTSDQDVFNERNFKMDNGGKDGSNSEIHDLRIYDETSGNDADKTASISYRRINDFSSYHIKYKRCTRIQSSDTYSIGNGNITSYEHLVSLQLCTTKSNFWHSSENCDSSIDFVIHLNDYLESIVQCVERYCIACSENCEHRRSGECRTCRRRCNKYARWNAKNETEIISCVRTSGESGSTNTQYFYDSICESDGSIGMDAFRYPNCTIKAAKAQPEQKFGILQELSEMCMDCDSSSGGNFCANIYDNSYRCLVDQPMETRDSFKFISDQRRICSDIVGTSSKIQRRVANNSYGYSTYSKYLIVMVIAALLVVLFVILFISYTYYVRHHVDWGASSLVSWRD